MASSPRVLTREQLVEACARAAHEANLVYCLALGDSSQKHWEETPESIQQGTKAGVEAALSGATPEQLHQLWCAGKYRDGWKHGPKKDLEKKTHPNLTAYSNLPIAERRKDALYQATVRAVAEVLAGQVG
jgi:hypothetical protein